jgi:hypothetical protein
MTDALKTIYVDSQLESKKASMGNLLGNKAIKTLSK